MNGFKSETIRVSAEMETVDEGSNIQKDEKLRKIMCTPLEYALPT
jgi:hypothetical protein